ncbi:Big-1 (bacterial Ig-like domain 1) domain containing protein [Candidatus Nanopelagicaceae bacterium]
MSTKTTFKRVALVAVAALGLGVLSSVAPASARSTGMTISLGTATANAAIVGQVSTITVPTTVSVTGSASDTYVVSAVVSAYASASAPTITAVAGAAVTAGTGYTAAGSWAAADNKATFTFSAAVPSTTYPLSTANTFTFTPTAAGSYTIAYFLDGGSDVAATGALKGSDTVKYITVTAVTSAAATVAMKQQLAGTGSSTGTNGLWVRVNAADSAGALTRLNASQMAQFTIPTGLTLVGVSNGSTTTTVSQTATTYALGAANFNASGYAWLNFTGTAGTKALTAKISDGATSSSLSLVYAASAGTPVVGVVGTAGNSDGTDIPAGANGVAVTGITGSTTANSVSTTSTSDTFEIFDNVADAVTYVSITDTDFTIFGALTAFTQDITVTFGAVDTAAAAGDPAAGLASATFDVAHAALGSKANTTVKKSFTYTPSGLSAVTVTGVTGAVGSGQITIKPAAAVQVVNGGSITVTATFVDQYGVAAVGKAITASVSGRNTSAAATNLVTDATGTVSYTVTDALPTSATLTDTVTFSGGAASGNTVTITYVSALTASTMTTSPSATTTTASAPKDLGAVDSSGTASAGADAVTATVKDANGVAIAGLPVTITLPAGVSLKSTSTATAYTNASGVATWSVYTTKAGTYALSFAGGGLTKTGYVKWTAGTARVVSVTAGTADSGTVPVTISVTDANGNGVSAASVSLVATGGYFQGLPMTSTQTTSADGTLVVAFVGSGSVKATISGGQSLDLAGYVGTTAAAGYPAGVATVTVAVDGGTSAAQTASDAAAEATDAANAATDAANAAAEAADAATAAAQDAADAVAALSTQVTEMVSALKKQITALTNLVIKIQKKVKA